MSFGYNYDDRTNREEALRRISAKKRREGIWCIAIGIVTIVLAGIGFMALHLADIGLGMCNSPAGQIGGIFDKSIPSDCGQFANLSFFVIAVLIAASVLTAVCLIKGFLLIGEANRI